MDGNVTSKSGPDGLSVKFDASTKPTLSVDVERYQAYLDGTNMTPAQKEEFLQNLWQVIVSFVEIGFGVHPLQEVCGKDAQTNSQYVSEAFDDVSSDEPKKTTCAHKAVEVRWNKQEFRIKTSARQSFTAACRVQSKLCAVMA